LCNDCAGHLHDVCGVLQWRASVPPASPSQTARSAHCARAHAPVPAHEQCLALPQTRAAWLATALQESSCHARTGAGGHAAVRGDARGHAACRVRPPRQSSCAAARCTSWWRARTQPTLCGCSPTLARQTSLSRCQRAAVRAGRPARCAAKPECSCLTSSAERFLAAEPCTGTSACLAHGVRAQTWCPLG